jgi:beta-galactosidase
MDKGIDYYPEHWNYNLIDEDLQRFVSWGINLIRIGEFAWCMMESEPGSYDFSFFDQVISKAKQYGLRVMFGTPTATFPAWLAAKPGVLLDHGHGPVSHGGRREYCYNSPTYQYHVCNMVTALVKHYALEPAVVSWQIDNEVGHESSDYCVCDHCQRAFRDFLQAKYQSVDVMNQRMGLIFWGHEYTSFEQVMIPKTTITCFNPSLMLDFYRFRSVSAVRYINKQAQLIREYKGDHQSVTHDFEGGGLTKLIDFSEVAKELDFVCYNNYPVWGGLDVPGSPSEIALQLDYIRGLKGQLFTITEQLMGAQGHTMIGYLPRPNQAYLWSMQAIGHGCNNLYYFRERGMDKGQEQFCYGLIGHDNQDNRRVTEAKRFFKDIDQLQSYLDRPINNKIAILYDYDNISSWRIQPQSKAFNFMEEFHRLYAMFHHWNIGIDIIPVGRDLSQYQIIVLPVMQIIDNTLAQQLESMRQAGKTIIFGFRSGIKNQDNNIHFGLTNPCLIAEMCGITIEEVEALPPHTNCTLVDDEGNHYDGQVWRDLIRPTTATSLLTYQDEFFPGYSAVTKNDRIYYLGTALPSDYLNVLAYQILVDQQLQPITSSPGVEIINRDGFTMTLNHQLSYQDEFPPLTVTLNVKE